MTVESLKIVGIGLGEKAPCVQNIRGCRQLLLILEFRDPPVFPRLGQGLFCCTEDRKSTRLNSSHSSDLP